MSDAEEVVIDPTKTRVLRWVLHPTPEQENTLRAWEASQRRLWNLALGQHTVWQDRPVADRAKYAVRVRERAAAAKAAKDAGLPPPPAPPNIDDTTSRWLRPDWVSQCADLTPLRVDPAWSAVPCEAQQSLLKTLDESCAAARSRIRKWPRFKHYDDPCGLTFIVKNGAFRCRNAPAPGESEAQPGWCDVVIPKLGAVRARCPLPVTGTVLQMRVVRRVDRWILCVWQRLPDLAKPVPERPRIVGVNRGVVELAATSDGLCVPGIGVYDRTLAKIAAARAEAAAMVAAGTYDKAAKRRINTRLQALHVELRKLREFVVEGLKPQIGVLAEKVAPTVQSAKRHAVISDLQSRIDKLRDRREDREAAMQMEAGDDSIKLFASKREMVLKARYTKLSADGAERRLQRSHALSKAIVQRGDVIVFDGLNLAEMTKSEKREKKEEEFEEIPGESRIARKRRRRDFYRRKAVLNRKMLDGALGQTQVLATYKAADLGRVVVSLPPVNISTECPACGNVDPANHPSAVVFCCARCGHEENANVLAAKHLASRYERGERPPEKREKVSIAKRGKGRKKK